MMLGPCSAPYSPPDTPVPRKRRPRSAMARSRRTVSSNQLLPPSISRSPSSRWPASSSRTASTAGPALTMTRMRRGFLKAATNSAVEKVPTSSPSEPWRSSSSRVLLSVRLWTATGNPLRATLRARLAPMVARPVTPSSQCPAIGLLLLRRLPCGHATQRSPPYATGSGVGGGLAQPGQVAGAAVVDRDGGQLRGLVAVVGLDVGGEGVEAGGGGLDDAEPLVGGLDRAPPPVGAGDRAEHLHTRGQAPLDQVAGQPLGVRAGVGGGHGHQVPVGHGASPRRSVAGVRASRRAPRWIGRRDRTAGDAPCEHRRPQGHGGGEGEGAGDAGPGRPAGGRPDRHQDPAEAGPEGDP